MLENTSLLSEPSIGQLLLGEFLLTGDLREIDDLLLDGGLCGGLQHAASFFVHFESELLGSARDRGAA